MERRMKKTVRSCQRGQMTSEQGPQGGARGPVMKRRRRKRRRATRTTLGGRC
jgi:hypothetical protein